jgi:hypothetical protein
MTAQPFPEKGHQIGLLIGGQLQGYHVDVKLRMRSPSLVVVRNDLF